MRARIRDTEIFFDVDGAALIPDGSRVRERPTAFLVHGGPGTDHTGLKARFRPLAERMQLVYFDQRGHGRSARGDPAKYTLDEGVEDLEELRRYLGLGPIVSIGGSYGGKVAMAHAARYPESVSHLILIAATCHPGSLAKAKEILYERGTAEQISVYEDLCAGRIDTPEKLRRYFEITGPLYSRRYDSKSAVGLGATLLDPEPINRAFGPGGFLWNLDLRPELGAITAPTLILSGRHDWRCAPEYSEELHRLIPDSDLRIFEESSHTLGSDEPQQLMDAIIGFLIYRTKTQKTQGRVNS